VKPQRTGNASALEQTPRSVDAVHMRLHLLRHDPTRDQTPARPAAVWGVDAIPASQAVIHASRACDVADQAQLAQTA
jgi:hypothetical protein